MNKIRISLSLAFKSIIRGNRWAALMIVVLMALSFTNLLLTPSIMSGVTHSLDSQQINTIFGNIVVTPSRGNAYIDDVSQATASLEQMPGVTGVAPHLAQSAVISYQPEDAAAQTSSGNWTVTGIDPGRESSVTTISKDLIAGSYLAPSDTDAIVIGVEIAGGPQAENADFLTLGGVGVGDTVSVTFANGVERSFTVKGIFQAQDGQADSQAFITQTEMASVMGGDSSGDMATQILVKISDDSQEASVISAFNNMGLDAVARSWRDYGGSVSGVVSSFNVVTSLIGIIGLVVAGIVMFVVIYINAMHKKRQIGILRAVGINRGTIMLSFVTQAMLYAVLGIVLGGLLFGAGIQPYFAAHPINLPIGSVSLAVNTDTVVKGVMGILAASLLAGIIPVMSITRQNIIRSIWGT